MQTLKPSDVARARKAASAASPRRLRVGAEAARRVIIPGPRGSESGAFGISAIVFRMWKWRRDVAALG